MTRPVIIIGAGGHARVLLDALLITDMEILGLVDSDPALLGEVILGTRVIGNDAALRDHPAGEVSLVNGIGSVKNMKARRGIYERFAALGYEFAGVVHPTSWVSTHAVIEPDAQIMAGCIIQAEVQIDKNVIVNTGSSIDHNCRVGDHCHIAPGATLSGTIELGTGVHVGTGASIIQGLKIGDGATIAAGAAVISHVAANARVAGVPARTL
jgi:UDP-perosamine 4-acetyltransferase